MPGMGVASGVPREWPWAWRVGLGGALGAFQGKIQGRR